MDFQQFQAMMANFAAEYLDPIVKAKNAREEFERATDNAFRDIFSGYTEMTSTIDALDLVATLVSVRSPRSNKVKNDDYIKFRICRRYICWNNA
ncbi:hypothetical protein [Paraburkholderia sp. HP33-1]|uniref:hypothetical protein n=1 Tax=Paraburkholderia sp. HP33-1 TaxID=2883243 RepID=UPI001F2F5505|nr:hypothetical protein [Paraburkholderia sp. HP33-1]